MYKKIIVTMILPLLALAGYGFLSKQESFQEEQLGLAIPKIIAVYEDNLQSKITSTDTSMALVRGTDDTGSSLSGDYGFVIDEGSSNEEFVICTASGTALTSCTRGISIVDEETSVTSLKKSHRKGASIKITNFPQLAIISRIANGDEGFPNALYFDQNINYTSASSSWIVDKNYADSLAIAGAPNALTTLQGIVELGTTSEYGVDYGSTGAWLVPTMSIASSTPTANYLVVSDGSGRINTGWISDLDFTWSGEQTFNATTTFSGQVVNNKSSYAMTASTTITGGTLPQPVYASSTLSGAVLLSQAATTTATTVPIFNGFAVTNASNGGAVYVQTDGIVTGFSGLTAGSDYYVGTTTAGIITATVPTNSYPIVRVGRAISATTLLIEKDENYVGGDSISQSDSSGTCDITQNSTIPWYVKKVIAKVSANGFTDVRAERIRGDVFLERYNKPVSEIAQYNSNGTGSSGVSLTATWTDSTIAWTISAALNCDFSGTLYYYY